MVKNNCYIKNEKNKDSHREVKADLSAVLAKVAPEKGSIQGQILPLCKKWHIARELYLEDFTEKNRLEEMLIARMGSARVCITEKGKKALYAASKEYVDILLDGEGDFDEARRESLKAELAQRQKAWNREARNIGLTKIEKRMERTFRFMDKLEHKIATIPAQSLEGIKAKLQILAAIGAWDCPDMDEFPWNFVKSVVADLEGLCKTLR